MQNMNILTGIQTVDNYPYGRLQCEMSFSVEYVKNKGYRSVMQSVNPKTGRLNAPKKSTYSHFMFMYKDEETGHIKFGGMDIRGFEDIEKFIELLSNNKFEFTPEESQNIYAIIIASIRGNLNYFSRKEGVTNDELFEATKVREIIQLYGAKASLYDIIKVGYDLKEINKLRA